MHRAILLSIFFVFLVALEDNVIVAAKIRVLELSLCRDYYLLNDPKLVDPGGYVREEDCKINSIQTQLAALRAWMSILENIPSTSFW
jgi:hypothetical protein